MPCLGRFLMDEQITTFSVILPVFNVEEYLEKCLNSLLPALSTYDEVILALGDSTDQSTRIAERYAHTFRNVHLLWQDGKGLSNARNCAVDMATGDYVVYIDCDDCVNTALFKTVLRNIRYENRRFDLYVFDCYHYNPKTGRVNPWFQIGKGNAYTGIENIGRMLHKHKCFWNVWRYIYRRSFLKKNNIVFRENCLSEDVDYTTRVLLAYPDMSFIHAPFYIYTVGRSGSLMNRPTYERLRDTVMVLEDSISSMQRSNYSFSKRVAAQYQFEYILNMALIYEIPKESRIQGAALYTNWRQTLSYGKDIYVRVLAVLLQVLGIMPVAYLLNKAKLTKRKIQRRIET